MSARILHHPVLRAALEDKALIRTMRSVASIVAGVAGLLFWAAVTCQRWGPNPAGRAFFAGFGTIFLLVAAGIMMGSFFVVKKL